MRISEQKGEEAMMKYTRVKAEVIAVDEAVRNSFLGDSSEVDSETTEFEEQEEQSNG